MTEENFHNSTDPNSANADGSNEAEVGSADPLEQGSTDPFAPENQAVLNFIMQARIYDVLMALLTESNKDLAKDLLELHATGALMGSAPSFNGQFITDLVNDEEPQG